jgi:hypothetical protein
LKPAVRFCFRTVGFVLLTIVSGRFQSDLALGQPPTGNDAAADVTPVPLETPSQRWLPMPSQSAGLSEQLLMLQQLRNLISGDSNDDANPSSGPEVPRGSSDASPPPPDSSEPASGPAFGPQQLDQLRRLMNSMKGQMPGSGIPELPKGTVPEDVEKLLGDPLMQQQISKAWEDPRIRSQVKEMLERFSRDGTLPQNPGSRHPGGIPFPQKPSPDDQSSSAPRSFGDFLKRLLDVQDKTEKSLSETLPEGIKPDQSDRSVGRARPVPSDPPEPLPQISPKPNVDDLRNSRRRSSAGATDEQRSNQNPRSSQVPLTPKPYPGIPGTPLKSGSGRNLGAARSPDSLHPNPLHRKTEPGGGNESSEILDVARELQRSGLGGTLEKLIQEGIREGKVRPDDSPQDSGVDGTAGGSSSGSDKTPSADDVNGTGSRPGSKRAASDSDPTRSIIRTLDGLRRDLADLAKDQPPASAPGATLTPGSTVPPQPVPLPQSPSGGDVPPNSSSTLQSPAASTPSQTGRPKSPPEESHLNKAVKSIAEFLSEIASAPSRSESSERSSIPEETGGGDLLTESSGAVVLALLAGGMLILITLAAVRNRLAAARTGGFGFAAGGLSEAGRKLQTREDIVRVFHQLATSGFRPAELWWTHRVVAKQAGAAAPDRADALVTLAGLYEQARYLPAEVVFTSEQLAEARRALEQCEARS